MKRNNPVVTFSCFKVFQSDTGTILKTLVQQNAEIKEQLKVVTGTVQEILRRQRSVEGVQRGRLPDDVQLPLRDYAALREMETKLQSQDVYNNVVRSAFDVLFEL